MEAIVLTGSSVEKILEEFSRGRKIKLDDIQYEVIEEGKSGFLGFFGSKKAQIKITSFGIKQEVMTFLEKLLDKMEIEFVDIEESETKDSLNYHIVGSSDPGFLIGKEARFLNNMQYLINRIFEDKTTTKRIYLDVDNYKERQAEQVIRKYEPILDKVVSNQKPYTLEPLDPNIRRVIHKFIESRPEISTLTIGEGKMKRIVVFPKDYDQTKIRKRSYTPPSRRTNNNQDNSDRKANPRPHSKTASTANSPKTGFKPRKKPYRKPKKQSDSDTE